MRDALEQLAGGHQFYHARSDDYATPELIPFQVSSDPLAIDASQADTIARIGEDLSSYMSATADLYRTDETARLLLDRGKPEIFKSGAEPNYLFYRPDIIITPDGLAICEIETSIFGLGLAELLNRGYALAGHETMADPTLLTEYVEDNTPSHGTIVHSDNTQAFAGQLDYLAETVFSGNGREWSSANVNELEAADTVYRAHYLVEYLSNPAVSNLYESLADKQTILPSLTPQFEEKAILAFLWDRRYESFYRSAIGGGSFDFLRTVIPPTWIVGEEANFSPGLPHGYEDSSDLAELSRKQREFILKVSGFSKDEHWSKGVVFLQSKSKNDARAVLTEARSQSTDQLYVVQQFQEGVKLPMTYETAEGSAQMDARVRLTPYFAAKTGELLTIKATGCEGTYRIHASTASINTAVSVR